MRLLHIPFTYFPSPCGGTEVYVAGLCRELPHLGIHNWGGRDMLRMLNRKLLLKISMLRY